MSVVVSLTNGSCELIGAGSGPSAAGVALEGGFDLINCPAVDQLGDGLEVAVAAACKSDVGDDVSVDVKVNLNRADALRFIRIIHTNSS